ncbi:hypothetical protein GUITHDRAFT_134076 [Guillardia theta CCMP2712]|uniref:Uncharacterized protein n=1 Tax=Guillardia theta (strain CCMP2712) TaxID=905079 RepID=L1JT10_GUITC|nr:hypothetical protein GUITHDRAFT_134076 [Guillardia theta CCMP2712]EKX51706.1 hypothetical protein GUITHDRAFT_134076 [Guillardia theta CCMP2712]|eukprot:XP_005838686.1 hypothetical protein GUITHDRAFT_134076 [Guillardia theta CCMP2712]
MAVLNGPQAQDSPTVRIAADGENSIARTTMDSDVESVLGFLGSTIGNAAPLYIQDQGFIALEISQSQKMPDKINYLTIGFASNIDIAVHENSAIRFEITGMNLFHLKNLCDPNSLLCPLELSGTYAHMFEDITSNQSAIANYNISSNIVYLNPTASIQSNKLIEVVIKVYNPPLSQDSPTMYMACYNLSANGNPILPKTAAKSSQLPFYKNYTILRSNISSEPSTYFGSLITFTKVYVLEHGTKLQDKSVLKSSKYPGSSNTIEIRLQSSCVIQSGSRIEISGIDGAIIRHGINFFSYSESFSAFDSGPNGTFYWNQSDRIMSFYSLRNITEFEDIIFNFTVLNSIRERPSCNAQIALLGGDAVLLNDLPPPKTVFLVSDLNPNDATVFVSNPNDGLAKGTYIKIGFEIMQIQELYSTISRDYVDALSNVMYLISVSEVSPGVLLKVDQELMRVQSIEGSLSEFFDSDLSAQSFYNCYEHFQACGLFSYN